MTLYVGTVIKVKSGWYYFLVENTPAEPADRVLGKTFITDIFTDDAIQ